MSRNFEYQGKRLKVGDKVVFGRLVNGRYEMAEGEARVILIEGLTATFEDVPADLQRGDYLWLQGGLRRKW